MQYQKGRTRALADSVFTLDIPCLESSLSKHRFPAVKSDGSGLTLPRNESRARLILFHIAAKTTCSPPLAHYARSAPTVLTAVCSPHRRSGGVTLRRSSSTSAPKKMTTTCCAPTGIADTGGPSQNQTFRGSDSGSQSSELHGNSCSPISNSTSISPVTSRSAVIPGRFRCQLFHGFSGSWTVRRRETSCGDSLRHSTIRFSREVRRHRSTGLTRGSSSHSSMVSIRTELAVQITGRLRAVCGLISRHFENNRSPARMSRFFR